MTATAGWEQALGYFADAGISTPRWEIVTDVEGAREALQRLTFPIAVKAAPGGTIDHKAELGLVETNLADVVSAEAAIGRMLDTLPGGPLMLQEMFHSHVELLVSVRQDRDFGPIVTLGHGGQFVEALLDVAHLALPVEPDDVYAALEGLRVSRLLRDFRGYPDRDVASLVRAVCSLAQAFSHRINGEIEINPLLVGALGEGVVAVDVVLNASEANLER